jgi:hypothetical protein
LHSCRPVPHAGPQRRRSLSAAQKFRLHPRPDRPNSRACRSARNVVAALTRDPPPRPDVLVIDFDAIAPVDLVELHAIRPGGWCGRMIGVGHVPPGLCASLGVDDVLAPPLVRDSLLDCVAGTRHAAVTTACPVFPEGTKRS